MARHKIYPYTFVLLCLSFCSCAILPPKWDKTGISNTLHTVFPKANDIQVMDAKVASNDIKDSVNMPSPLFKAYVKEKSNPGLYDWVFYFYDGEVTDTSFITPILKGIFINAIKTGIGTKNPGYILTLPYYDSTFGTRLLVPGISVSTQSDSAYLVNKEHEIMKAFGMFSKNGTARIKKQGLTP